MRRAVGGILLVLALVAVCVPPAVAYVSPQPCASIFILVAYAHEALTVSTTAVGFTAATYASGDNTPTMAEVTTETAIVHYRTSGTPTATTGHQVATATRLYVCGPAIGSIKWIRDSGAGSDATLRVTYYRKQ